MPLRSVLPARLNFVCMPRTPSSIHPRIYWIVVHRSLPLIGSLAPLSGSSMSRALHNHLNRLVSIGDADPHYTTTESWCYCGSTRKSIGPDRDRPLPIVQVADGTLLYSFFLEDSALRMVDPWRFDQIPQSVSGTRLALFGACHGEFYVDRC